MRMTFSSLLRWGAKRKADDERRDEGRFVAEGPIVAYWTTDSAYTKVRGQLRDASEDGSGIGFRLPQNMPTGKPGWVITAGGETFGGMVRHSDAKEGFYRVGIQMSLETKELDGWGGVTLRWIDDQETIQEASASLRNGADGVLEVNSVGEPPVGTLMQVFSPRYSCLCLVRACKAYGKRFLLEVETVSEATETPEAEIAA